MNINLPTGLTITISAYEYLFILKDEDMHEFYQSCVADNLGVYINDPFSNRHVQGKVDMEDIPDDLIDNTEI